MFVLMGSGIEKIEIGIKKESYNFSVKTKINSINLLGKGKCICLVQMHFT